MARRYPLSAKIPCLRTLTSVAAVLLLVSLHSGAAEISEELITRWKDASRRQEEHNADFDEQEMGIVTMNLEIEYSTASKKGVAPEGRKVSCLNKHISEDDGEIHIVGFKPESRDRSVDKIILYGCPQLATGQSVK
ncbi:uncharacterized protein LOC110987939 [Acanthaster planci]|uniref:Uncharacterized protein LOC110987939 n=1 Tax=Acanthaster planci TaxID=133434 RepID=A0A8B7ZMY5_ACAPL|nr:uncharacterized protein LOC110987939 [Acanthaster planci]